MQRQNMRVAAELIEYATVIRIVRLENERRRILQMRVRDRDERPSRARRNQQLQRRRFWIDLNVIEARDLLRNGFAQLADAFRGTVMIAARLD